MKTQTLLVSLILAVAACGDDDGVTVFPDAPPQVTPDAPQLPDAPPGITRVDVTGDIMGDTEWTADHEYILKRHIFVRSGTLTIEPGVKIYGDGGSSLVITTGARMVADATADEPIVFSSSLPPGTRAPGDWGGVVVLGLAPINVLGGTSNIEGYPDGTMGIAYGGTDAAHDCGTIRFVRIEFAGFRLTANNEINGLTLGGCGSATVVENVQVHKGKDDALEIFGGSVNVKRVVLSQMEDDGLDWDFGWVGKAQFVIIQEGMRSNQGIEADNNGNDNEAMPRSAPTIYNMTMVGSDAAPGGALDTQKGMHLRRGTAGKLYNVIVAHFADFTIDIDGASTVAQVTAAALSVEHSIFFDNGNQVVWDDTTDNDAMFVEGTYFRDSARVNMEMDPQITSALDPAAPSFKPAATSPAMTSGMALSPPSDGFFEPVTFIGAVGADDWTAGWTAFPAN